MKISVVRLCAIAMLSILSVYCNAQSVVDKAVRDEVFHMSREEPAMRKAFQKAAATLDDFLKIALDPKPDTSSHSVKVAISDGRNTEYFWVNALSVSGDSFIGTLNNELRLVMKHKLGDKINFYREQIADWTYTDRVNRRMVGNFTACALLTKEPPAKAEDFKRQFGLQCE